MRLRRAGATSSARPTFPFSPATSRPTTAFTGRAITLGNKTFPPVGPRAEPRRPSPPASARTSAARSAGPRVAAGVFCLKKTWDVVSTYGHIPPMPELHLERDPELLVAGPLARSAADLALALGVLAGPRDPLMPAEALASPRNTTPRGLRVALWLDEPFAPVDATVAAAVRKAALMLAEAGAIVDESGRPAFSFEKPGR